MTESGLPVSWNGEDFCVHGNTLHLVASAPETPQRIRSEIIAFRSTN